MFGWVCGCVHGCVGVRVCECVAWVCGCVGVGSPRPLSPSAPEEQAPIWARPDGSGWRAARRKARGRRGEGEGRRGNREVTRGNAR